MKARIAAVLLALALMVVGVSVLPSARGAVGAPTWAVSDSWTYEGFGFNDLIRPPAAGTSRFTVVDEGAIDEAGISIPVFHVVDMWNITGTKPIPVADEWFRESDLALVRVGVTSATCNVGYPYTCLNQTITQTATPPLPRSFPLTAGAQWSASTTVTTEWLNLDNGSARWGNFTATVNASVAADTQVTVPAGNFTVTPLTENYSSLGLVLDPFGWSYVVRDFSSTVQKVVDQRDYVVNARPGIPLSQIAGIRLVSYSLVPWYDLKALGIPLWGWLVVAAAVVLAVVTLLILRRRSRVSAVPPEGGGSPPPQAPPSKPP